MSLLFEIKCYVDRKVFKILKLQYLIEYDEFCAVSFVPQVFCTKGIVFEEGFESLREYHSHQENIKEVESYLPSDTLDRLCGS